MANKVGVVIGSPGKVAANGARANSPTVVFDRSTGSPLGVLVLW